MAAISRMQALRGRLPWAAPALEEFPHRGSQPDGEFSALFFDHMGRRCVKWHHYFPIYDQLFGPYRQRDSQNAHQLEPLRFLEIGVFDGGSLELWRKYFGPTAIIHGVDIDPRCAALSTPDLPVHVGNQADPGFLTRIVAEMGGVDIVLDDGSHQARHQRASFDALFPLLNEGGTYIIEDTHTSYWHSFGGGLRRPGTSIQFTKSLVDGMHKWFFRAPVSRRAAMARDWVSSIHFYNSVVAIHKKRQQRPEVSGRPAADQAEGC